MNEKEFAAMLENRLLSTDVDYPNITNACYEAREYGMAAVTVFPAMVAMCKETLKDAPVNICALVSYPHGGFTPEQKAGEALEAVELGAREIESVGNTREAKSLRKDFLIRDMKTVKEAVGDTAQVKFIIEIESLSDEEVICVCQAAIAAKIDWIVTSTGEYCVLDENKNDVMLVPTVREVALIKSVVGDDIRIQAEGNIVNLETALSLIDAGAERISSPVPVKLIKEFRKMEETKDV